MSEAGLSQAGRTTIDLLVPEAYAGAGRRAARIPGQRNAATRAEGIELALYDRAEMSLSPLPGDPDRRPVDIMVAGHAALLVAKAFTVRDRIKDHASRPHRLRAKDSSGCRCSEAPNNSSVPSPRDESTCGCARLTRRPGRGGDR